MLLFLYCHQRGFSSSKKTSSWTALLKKQNTSQKPTSEIMTMK